MILSDKTIKKMIKKGKLIVQRDLSLPSIQPASYDITLGCSFKTPKSTQKYADFDTKLEYKDLKLSKDGYITVKPKQFVLATTLEYIKLPDNVAAFVEGRSSIGRMGLFIQNAGWVDPGFEGEITLELYNGSDVPIRLVPGHRVGQLVFAKMDKKAKHPYRGKYQGQTGATGSKKYEDKKIKK